MDWVDSVNSVEKEEHSIKMFQQKMVDEAVFDLVILADDVPAGMIDLYELNSESGEVGYWLSKDFQHLGIMTKCVQLFVKKNRG